MSSRGTGIPSPGARSERGGDTWGGRWSQLARGVGIPSGEPVLLALSGGADSVFLLHVLAAADPRPRILAVHVDHRLRGEESRSDAAFCARLCARLGVAFARREVDLEREAPNLEARAREARYRVLAEEARAGGFRTILTGHHEDDALETLLLRWMRGSALPGLAGLRPRNVLGGSSAGGNPQVTVVRPLLNMRREEVRRLLRDAGHRWCEDSSNADPRFTRNRVRRQLLPEIERTCGTEGVDNLRAFASAVESLEEELAGRTAHLAWGPPADPDEGGLGDAPAEQTRTKSAREAHLGGTLGRKALGGLAPPLVRRALWRLLSEGTGLPPSRGLLAILEDDLLAERRTRRTLPGGWTLHLREEVLVLTPPASTPQGATPSGATPRAGDRTQAAPAGSVPDGGPPPVGLRLGPGAGAGRVAGSAPPRSSPTGS